MQKIIYKYRSWEKYAKDMLRNGELYFARKYEFKDKNDCTNYPEILSSHCDTVNAHLKHDYYQRLQGKGFFCTCQEYNNSNMWSEYGNENKGVCFGISLEKIMERSDILAILLISYVDSLDHIYIEPHVLEDTMLKIYSFYALKLSKYNCEDEIRVVKNLNDSRSDQKVWINDCITEAILGSSMPEPEARIIVNICIAKGIPVYRMLSDNSDRYLIYTPVPEHVLNLPDELLPQTY